MPTPKPSHLNRLAGIPAIGRAAWRYIVLAAATATTAYLLDSRGERLPTAVCLVLVALVASAFK